MAPSEAKKRGVRLQAARRLRGLSQIKAAKSIGVSRTTLSGWENGEPIDEQWVPEIVRVLGGSKAWVRYGEGAPPDGYSEMPGESHFQKAGERPFGSAKKRRKGSA